MLWWRIELDKTGAILKCDQVEAVSKGSALIAFVQAKDRTAACRSAKAWHERYRARHRAADKRLRERRKEARRCRSCEKPVGPGSTFFCEHHLEQNREAQRRWYAGQTVPRAPADPEQVRAKELAGHRQFTRMNIQLVEVLTQFDALDGDSLSPFRWWLLREIAERQEHHVTKEAQAAE